MIRVLVIVFLFALSSLHGQEHPNLTITSEGVKMIRAELGKVQLFDQSLEKVKQEVDAEIELGIFVPVPKDMAGGYTHERHKKNFFILQKAGNLYQITGDEKYANYIKNSLLKYAELYPSLPVHPTNKSYATGKIFWQCLNDANWLVYVSQAYDCIYNYLTEEERSFIEKDLFRPFAEFLSIENPKFFNRIHNHSTWANAAVGMIALVMNDQELLDWSLYGLPNDGIKADEVDNDGGYIKVSGERKAGFLAQLDYSFAPDGYFTEGPYYLRYAIFPFLVYAKALHLNKPELDILNYRDAILNKSLYALLLQTDAQGEFFPINDSQKGMSIAAREIITAIDFLYTYYNADPTLLSIVEKQGNVLIDESGFKVASDLKSGMAKPFYQTSVTFGDGAEGDEGGIGVLRDEETCVVFKYSAQGMGHGHFDKLSYSYYDDTGEVLQDYGAVRWVNIDQKGGGRYLPENKTFGKQSIAHNTLVVNEQSHYEGSVKKGEAHHPELYAADFSDQNGQLLSAYDNYAYPEVGMHRSLLLLNDKCLKNPLLVDIYKVESSTENQYDLPHWYMGHLLSVDIEYKKEMSSLQTLGTDNGYEHLWKEAMGYSKDDHFQLTWFGNGKFFTLNSVVDTMDQLIFARLGANDQNFNFRSDPVFIHRKLEQKSTSYVNVIESHGTYDPISEIPQSPFSEISKLELLLDNDDYSVVNIKHISGTEWQIFISVSDNNADSKHRLSVDGNDVEWEGVYKIVKINK